MPFGESMYAFLLSLFRGMELLVQMVCMCSALADIASFLKWFFLPIYTLSRKQDLCSTSLPKVDNTHLFNFHYPGFNLNVSHEC